MTAQQIHVFTAVKMETRAIRAALPSRQIHTVGIGANHLPAREQLAGASLILLCGVAGALNPALNIGDLILDDRSFPLSSELEIRRGMIVTATQIVANPTDKAALFAQTGGDAVDMEQSVVQAFADQCRIPLISLRAISDTASQTLDPAVVHLVDDLGRPRPLNIATTLLRRPSLIPYLRELNANTQLALRQLGPAVCAVIEHLTHDIGLRPMRTTQSEK
jgi:adenosylhomocysteine nucleosidase